jgi:hypothetical protein
MQVFTTIFLADKLSPNMDRSEEIKSSDRSGLVECEEPIRDCIVTLETRAWLEGDGKAPARG